jgi:hypothetical protein
MNQIEIVAPVEQVYAVAVDPESVPSYVPEVARIELVKRQNERSALVRSYLRFGRMTFAYLYRYRYYPPTHYSGVQESGRLLRGYFSLIFQSRGDRTIVSHAEGVLSPVPFLATAVGFIYFRVLSSGGARKELGRLKSLVESGVAQQDVSSCAAAHNNSFNPTPQ